MVAVGYHQEYCGEALLKRMGYGSSITEQEDEFFRGQAIGFLSGGEERYGRNGPQPKRGTFVSTDAL